MFFHGLETLIKVFLYSGILKALVFQSFMNSLVATLL